MQQKSKLEVPDHSPFPLIAAGLSVLSAIFTCVNYFFNTGRKGMMMRPNFTEDALIPIVIIIIFAIFAVLFSKKILTVMIVPISLFVIHLYMYDIHIVNFLKIIRYLLSPRYLTTLFLVVLLCVLAFGILVTGVLAFTGVIKSNIVLSAFCGLYFIVLIIWQTSDFMYDINSNIWFFTARFFMLCAIIVFAAGLKSNSPIGNSYTTPNRMPPPYPTGVPGNVYMATPYDQGYQGSAAPQKVYPPQMQTINNKQSYENEFAYDSRQPATQIQELFDPLQEKKELTKDQSVSDNQPDNKYRMSMEEFNINVEKLKQLSELYKQGIITAEEYEERRKKLLSNI